MEQNKPLYEIHNTVREYALRHRLSIGRDSKGHYYIPGIDPKTSKLATRMIYSMYPTAKSGLVLLKNYKRYKTGSFL